VAIVTGAGNGLGRSYALFLASRGAKVVVNDLGGSTTGTGAATKPADTVVAEIVAKGGVALPSYSSVEDGEAIVRVAMEAWGRVDVLVNNAGILRDASFQKMKEEDW
jgi:NAD(P)-dependent dehydrogenase (short-subunit alcohol dehydrogenase family)